MKNFFTNFNNYSRLILNNISFDESENDFEFIHDWPPFPFV